MNNKIIDAIKQAHEEFISFKGGAGSGNFGHAGIPGHQGGSAAGKGAGGGMSQTDPNKNAADLTAQLRSQGKGY